MRWWRLRRNMSCSGRGKMSPELKNASVLIYLCPIIFDSSACGLFSSLLTQSAIPAACQGKTIAFSPNRDGNSEIYTMKLDNLAVTRLTDNPADDGEPAWSPDGTKMLLL